MQTCVPALRAHPSGAVPCVKETALAANSGGQNEITTKWVLNAQETQKGIESLKDKSGETITYSKGLQIMELLFESGLNETQRTAMYEYLDVPEKIRHWNKARVAEQLKIMRRKVS